MERELSITLKYDGEDVIAEITEGTTGDSVVIREAYEPGERNPVWKERVADELYNWVEMDMENDGKVKAKKLFDRINDYIRSNMREELEKNYPDTEYDTIMTKQEEEWIIDEIEVRLYKEPLQVLYAFWPFFDRTGLFANADEHPHEKRAIELGWTVDTGTRQRDIDELDLDSKHKEAMLKIIENILKE